MVSLFQLWSEITPFSAKENTAHVLLKWTYHYNSLFNSLLTFWEWKNLLRINLSMEKTHGKWLGSRLEKYKTDIEVQIMTVSCILFKLQQVELGFSCCIKYVPAEFRIDIWQFCPNEQVLATLLQDFLLFISLPPNQYKITKI